MHNWVEKNHMPSYNYLKVMSYVTRLMCLMVKYAICIGFFSIAQQSILKKVKIRDGVIVCYYNVILFLYRTKPCVNYNNINK